MDDSTTDEALTNLTIPSSHDLHEALSTCDDPIAAIEQFQAQNSVLLPSLQPALKLMDLHGTKRLQFHHGVVSLLSETLKKRISEIDDGGSDKLAEILDVGFPAIRAPLLQPVLFSVMRKLSNIKPEYLTFIKNDAGLYRSCPIEVRQHIWKVNQDLFREEIAIHFDNFLVERRDVLRNSNSADCVFDMPHKKLRSTDKNLTTLCDMIGAHAELYQFFVTFIHKRYERSKNSLLCTLRSELLMMLRDRGTAACNAEPIGHLLWCIDACIRDGIANAKQLSQISECLHNLSKTESALDIGMVCADFHTTLIMLRSVMGLVMKCGQNETLPRDSLDELKVLLQLLSFGVHAYKFISSKEHKVKLDNELLTNFLPAMVSTSNAASFAHLKHALGDEVELEVAGELEILKKFCTQNKIASHLLLPFLLHLLPLNNVDSLVIALLGVLLERRNLLFNDQVLHLIVGELTPEKNGHFSTTSKLLVEHLFLKNLHNELATCHLLRLVKSYRSTILKDFPFRKRIQTYLNDFDVSDVSNAIQEKITDLLNLLKLEN